MGGTSAFARNLRILRAKRNLTQTEAARGIGIGQDRLSRYEQAKCQPEFATVVKIADFYGVTTDELVGRNAGD